MAFQINIVKPISYNSRYWIEKLYLIFTNRKFFWV